MAADEESDLVNAYRSTRRVRRPEGQGLNDLYVRFFRMAERKIASRGQGVVCFISNYSWLDGLSFTGMRERYLETFDTIRIDCLNGDKYKTGKVAPDGSPDPSIFSTEGDPVGIQVGTAIATLVRKSQHAPVESDEFRHLWGKSKPKELIDTAETKPEALYDRIEPVLGLGLPYLPAAVSKEWFDWPALTDLFQVSFSSIKTNRDTFLIDIDRARLDARITQYFDPSFSHSEIAQRYPAAMRTTAKFNAREVREELIGRGGPNPDGFIRFAYRPFDNRWLYWEAESGLLDTPCADYKPHVFRGNIWLEARKREPREEFCRGTVVRHLADNFGNGMSYFFPAYLRYESEKPDAPQHRHNLTIEAGSYVGLLDASVEDLFYHVISTLHDRDYRDGNAGALKMGWPRIPLPGWPDGKADGAAKTLAESAARGRELVRLLEPDAPVASVTERGLAAGNRGHCRSLDGR